jgi:hypothetical protein
MKYWIFATIAALGVPISQQQSQGGQDSILAGIFDVIRTTNQYYVEIGFNSVTHDGGSGSNTYALKKKVAHERKPCVHTSILLSQLSMFPNLLLNILITHCTGVPEITIIARFILGLAWTSTRWPFQ